MAEHVPVKKQRVCWRETEIRFCMDDLQLGQYRKVVRNDNIYLIGFKNDLKKF